MLRKEGKTLFDNNSSELKNMSEHLEINKTIYIPGHVAMQLQVLVHLLQDRIQRQLGLMMEGVVEKC